MSLIEHVVNDIYYESKIEFQLIIDRIGMYTSPKLSIQKNYTKKTTEYKGITYTLITDEEYINLLTCLLESRLDNIIFKKNSSIINLLDEKRDLIFENSRLSVEELIDSIAEKRKDERVNDFNFALSKLDNEMIRTIEVFFKCGLNLSEAAKELYIHRNTLIYRLDKIQKITSYDIREFNNAMIFKIIFLYNKKKKII
ncbi:helix-turn-helix domain-containing protein [uncultured Clostridium sp.]|uniref:PucR family transcriptional regulator n=2 Tax=uncultured Clostridium sp. TaxID=59620 RepID=UPI00263A3C43|nr:helix-turn-helix domain-containing protein [uncultured Clostridium sp.]